MPNKLQEHIRIHKMIGAGSGGGTGGGDSWNRIECDTGFVLAADSEETLTITGTNGITTVGINAGENLDVIQISGAGLLPLDGSGVMSGDLNLGNNDLLNVLSINGINWSDIYWAESELNSLFVRRDGTTNMLDDLDMNNFGLLNLDSINGVDWDDIYWTEAELDALYVRRDGTLPLLGDWDVGDFDIININQLAVGNAAPGTWQTNITGDGLYTGFLSAEGGVHVGGQTDPGDDNLLVDGDTWVVGNTGLGVTPINRLDVSGATAIGSAYAGIETPPTNGLIVEGSIGVGVIAPINKVDVEGSVAIGSAYSGTETAPTDGLIVEGQFGLGVVVPINKMDVEGAVAIGSAYSGTETAPAEGLIVEGAVGIGQPTPLNKVDIEGNVVIGAAYSGTNTAPTNGLLVEGTTGIGTTTPQSKLDVEGNVTIGAGYSGSTAAPANGLLIQGKTGIGDSFDSNAVEEWLHIAGNQVDSRILQDLASEIIPEVPAGPDQPDIPGGPLPLARLYHSYSNEYAAHAAFAPAEEHPSGNDVWLVCADDNVYTTNDPILGPWTETPNPAGGEFFAVLWIPEISKFVGVGYEWVSPTSYFFIATSTDGVSWTQYEDETITGSPAQPSVETGQLAYNPATGTIIAAGGSYNTYIWLWKSNIYSISNWTTQQIGIHNDEPGYCIGFGNGVWLVGADGADNQMWRSTNDGVSWTQIDIPWDGVGGWRVNNLAYSPELGRWLANGYNGHIMYSDDDGLTWTEQDGPGSFGGAMGGLQWDGTQWWMADGGEIFTSPTGLTGSWTEPFTTGWLFSYLSYGKMFCNSRKTPPVGDDPWILIHGSQNNIYVIYQEYDDPIPGGPGTPYVPPQDINVQEHVFRRSQGSLTSRTTVSGYDQLGKTVWQGYDGASFADAVTMQGSVDYRAQVVSGDVPGRLLIETNDTVSGLQKALDVRYNQFVGIDCNGLDGPEGLLHVAREGAVETIFQQAGEGGIDYDATLNWVAYPQNGDWNQEAGMTKSGSNYILVGPSGRITTSTNVAGPYTQRTSGHTYDFAAVHANGTGTVIAVASAGRVSRSTDDGINWTTYSMGGQIPGDVLFADGVWIAAANWGRVWRSTNDGVSWSIIDFTGDGNLNSAMEAVAYANGVWVGVGSWELIDSPTLYYEQSWYTSEDNGLTWTRRITGYETLGPRFNDIKYSASEDIWVAVGSGNIVYTDDPINGPWHKANLEFEDLETESFAYLQCVETDDAGTWMAMGQSIMGYSFDHKNWYFKKRCQAECFHGANQEDCRYWDGKFYFANSHGDQAMIEADPGPVVYYGEGSQGANLTFRRAKGDLNEPETLITGDKVSYTRWQAYDSEQYTDLMQFKVHIDRDATVAVGQVAGEAIYDVADDDGVFNPLLVLRGQTGHVGIWTEDPEVELHIAGVNGAPGHVTCPGYGDYSEQFGETSNADARGSVALGFGPQVHFGARYSMAAGYYSDVYEGSEYALAIGTYAEVGEDASYSTSIGYNAEIGDLSEYGIAIGTNAVIGYDSPNNVAIGYGTDIDDGVQDAIAIGTNADVDLNYGIAIGVAAHSDNEASIAIGSNALSWHPNDIALGVWCKAYGNNSIAIGTSVETWGTDATAIGYGASVGSGSGYTSSAVAIGPYSRVHDSASSGVSIGNQTDVYAADAVALGYNAQAHDWSSIAIGSSTSSAGSQGVSIGYGASCSDVDGDNVNIAIGMQSTIRGGSQNIALGRLNSISNGSNGAIAIGYDHAINYSPNANLIGSDSWIGDGVTQDYSNTLISNWSDIAEGGQNIGIGGSGNHIRGIRNVAIGNNVDAYGESNVCIGYWAKTATDKSNYHCIVVGTGADVGIGTTDSIAMGREASVTTNGIENVAIGPWAHVGADAAYGVSIGAGAWAEDNADYSVLIGRWAWCEEEYVVSVGPGSYGWFTETVAVGHDAWADDEGDIAIGSTAYATSYPAGSGAIAIGYMSAVGDYPDGTDRGIAVGAESYVAGPLTGSPIAIGDTTEVLHNHSIAMGTNVITTQDDQFTVSGYDLYWNDGLIGVGTDTPNASLHAVRAVNGLSRLLTINNPTDDTDAQARFLMACGGSYTYFTQYAPSYNTPGPDGISLSEMFRIRTEIDTSMMIGTGGSDNLYLMTTDQARITILDDGRVGISTQTPAVELHVLGTDGVSPGHITVPGSGANSEQFGATATASGSASIAMGRNANAVSTDNIAIGPFAYAANGYGVAFGSNTVAYSHAVAMGYLARAGNTAADDGGIAIGSGALSYTDNSIAVGRNAKVYDDAGTGNILVGYNGQIGTSCSNTIAIGTDVYPGGSTIATSQAVVIGYQADADNHNTIAIGAVCAARAESSIAIGASSIATSGQAVAVGGSANAGGTTGATVFGYDAAASGNYAIGIGHGVRASSAATVVIGRDATITTGASSAISIGRDSEADGDYAITIGPYALADSESSIAIGDGAEALSDYAIAFGYLAEASADRTVAIGYDARATVIYGTAVGDNARANSNQATALGKGAIASGAYSNALGTNAGAGAQGALAVGSASTANGNFNTAIGYQADAGTRDYSVALGYQATNTLPNQLMVGSATQGLDLYIYGDVRPTVSGVYDLGHPDYAWRDLYLSGGSLYLGNLVISGDGQLIEIQAPVVIHGELIADNATISGLNIGDAVEDTVTGLDGLRNEFELHASGLDMHPDYLLADGSRELGMSWDVGDQEILNVKKLAIGRDDVPSGIMAIEFPTSGVAFVDAGGGGTEGAWIQVSINGETKYLRLYDTK